MSICPATDLFLLRVRKGLFLVFLTFLLPRLGLAAGMLSAPDLLYEALPADIVFNQGVSRTQRILRALFLEDRYQFQSASKIWRTFPAEQPTIHEHLFKTDLMLVSSFQFSDRPLTMRSLLLMSRYYSWQNNWQGAVSILEDYQFQFAYGSDVLLEMVRLNLIMGEYDKAERLLASIELSTGREQMQVDVLQIWLYLLTGRFQMAVNGIVEGEANYLYLPHFELFPLDVYVSTKCLNELLAQSLVRFPSNALIFEQYIRLLRLQKDWDQLEAALMAQSKSYGVSLHWSVWGEVYANSGNWPKLHRVLTSRSSAERTPDFYDFIARGAVETGQWDILKEVSDIMQKRYPDLLDGKLYAVEYYRGLGDMQHAAQIMRELEWFLP